MANVQGYNLKPFTIIPAELYVERAADRQLLRILDEMGRPGYVLVARQMGKTNLLLNAKRSLGDGPDSFVYVDVSNEIPDLRSFFRSIIDTCVETNPGSFDAVFEGILIRRGLDKKLLEHKEHELELRDLLKSSSGRLVVCLDEIDALTRTEYSDQVFSFVRSIYFSGRTNFSEFARLTYVLSGVAEPAEIIKNRSISPFNIGEKIYLDDFSWSEFQEFLKKAQLTLDEEVSQRVYHWTRGNPRMTWDLCAAVERRSGAISSAVVDDIVDSLYLKSFDLPPVDHIRVLVEGDKEVRSAVMAMHYNRAGAISEAVRSRLYLAGIISISDSASEARIKNPIIEAGLSEKWLAEVERLQESTWDHANRLYREERYGEALLACELCETEGGAFSLDELFFLKGSCQYFKGDYAAAVATLSARPYPRASSMDFHIASRSRVASAQLLLGNLQESIDSFEKLIGEFGKVDGPQPASYYQAKINLSSAYLSSRPPNVERAVLLCESIIESPAAGGENDDVAAMVLNYKCLAYYRVYRARMIGGQRDLAYQAIGQAIDLADPNSKATLLLERTREFELGASRHEGVVACAYYCIENNVAISTAPVLERALEFSVERAATLLLELELARPMASSAFEDYLRFCSSSEVGHAVGAHKVIISAAAYAFAAQRSQAAIDLYGVGAKLQAPIVSQDYWTVLNYNLALCPKDQVLDFAEMYLHRVRGGTVMSEGIELRAVHRLVEYLIVDERPNDAIELLSKAGAPQLDLVSQPANFELLVSQYLRLIAEVAANPDVDRRSDVRALYELISSYAGRAAEYYPPDYKSKLLGQLVSHWPKEFAPRTVQRIGPKIGRNEIVKVRFPDGRVAEGKYKRFERAIEVGDVELIGLA